MFSQNFNQSMIMNLLMIILVISSNTHTQTQQTSYVFADIEMKRFFGNKKDDDENKNNGFYFGDG